MSAFQLGVLPRLLIGRVAAQKRASIKAAEGEDGAPNGRPDDGEWDADRDAPQEAFAQAFPPPVSSVPRLKEARPERAQDKAGQDERRGGEPKR